MALTAGHEQHLAEKKAKSKSVFCNQLSLYYWNLLVKRKNKLVDDSVFGLIMGKIKLIYSILQSQICVEFGLW